MQLIGPIVSLQVQADSLKVQGERWKYFDPTPITPVRAISLTDRGVVGVTDAGDQLVDVHNSDHPATKSRGNNHLSVGFTAHYDLMRERFPVCLENGVAGENVIVATNRRWLPEEVQYGLVLAVGDGRLITLFDVIVAKPCVEFSRWVTAFPEDQRPDRTVTEALQFLDNGVRGYYASYSGAPVRVSVGDRVYAVRPPRNG